MKVYKTVKSALLFNSTVATRFIFFLLNLGLLLEFINGAVGVRLEYALLHALTPSQISSNLFWGSIVTVYAYQLLRGLSGQVGIVSWWLEGVLGMALWLLIATSAILAEGFPGLVSFQALIAVWLFIRYPTHWGKKRA